MTLVKLISFLIIVESGGVDNAIGDNGKAVGCLQIHSIVVEDVNRIYDTDYQDKDRYDREKSIEIAKLYLQHYASEERLGRQPTIKDAARIWNGGPDGYREKETIQYWIKVKQQIRR